MSGEHAIEALMDTAMKSLRELVDVNTIIGDIIESSDGVAVIPVSRVSCGFLAGGGEYGRQKENMPFAGGSGAGITISPIAFLVVSSTGVVSLLPISQSSPSAIDQIVGSVPGILDQVKGFFDKKGNAEE